MTSLPKPSSPCSSHSPYWRRARDSWKRSEGSTWVSGNWGGAQASSNFAAHCVLCLGRGLPGEPSLLHLLDPGCPPHRSGLFSVRLQTKYWTCDHISFLKKNHTIIQFPPPCHSASCLFTKYPKYFCAPLWLCECVRVCVFFCAFETVNYIISGWWDISMLTSDYNKVDYALKESILLFKCVLCKPSSETRFLMRIARGISLKEQVFTKYFWVLAVCYCDKGWDLKLKIAPSSLLRALQQEGVG